ncbi:MAG: hypothetical protein Q8K60_07645 [Parachlamydiaceae bacterium]|nr:hypothetical protein [Parachlamydiaceae bacterium]
MENKSINTLNTLLNDFKVKYSSKYEIISDKSLGGGAYGIVFKANDINRKIEVAIKLYHDGIVPEGSERGWNLSSKTINRQIAPTYTIEPFDSMGVECKAVVSRFIPGKSLKETFAWCDKQEPSHKLLIADDLAHTSLPSLITVLELCHSLGFGHGDLHEGNIMIFPTDIREKYFFNVVLIDFDNSSIQTEELCTTEKDKIDKDCRLFKTRVGPYIIMDWKWKDQVTPIFSQYHSMRDFRIAFDILLPFINLVDGNEVDERNILDTLSRMMSYRMNGLVPKGLLDALKAVSKEAGLEQLFENTLNKFNEVIRNQDNWTHETEVIITENGHIKNSLYKSFFS